MKSSAGTALQYTLFGASHGPAIGITVEGLPTGFCIDFEKINQELVRRQGGASFNTQRQEAPEYEILSGIFEEKLTGTPLTVIFRNTSTKSKDYRNLITHPRPGHADYIAKVKYNDAQDYRGGGHFSGRLTTPLVFLGALAKQVVQKKYPTFAVCSHITTFDDVMLPTYAELRKKEIVETFSDVETEGLLDVGAILEKYTECELVEKTQAAVAKLEQSFTILDASFPVFDNAKTTELLEKAKKVKAVGDTIGGKIETLVLNPPLAIGEPFFNSVESVLAQLLYSIGTVQSIEFGAGAAFASVHGSEVKDEIIALVEEAIVTLYNHNGGVNGGITNGEAIVIGTTIKPIASIMQPQMTYNLTSGQIEKLQIGGRHDATIINRIIPVLEAVVSIGICDLMLQKLSGDWQ